MSKFYTTLSAYTFLNQVQVVLLENGNSYITRWVTSRLMVLLQHKSAEVLFVDF